MDSVLPYIFLNIEDFNQKEFHCYQMMHSGSTFLKPVQELDNDTASLALNHVVIGHIHKNN